MDLAGSGAEVAAWQIKRGSQGGVGVTERRADGVPTTQAVTAPVGGAVGGLALAGTGLGDALVGWAQGGSSAQQIATVVVDAPPDPFAVQAPVEFVRRPPEIRWDVPAHAIGGVTFAVTVDDDTVGEKLRGTRLKLKRRDLDDGVHVLQVVAEDSGGQETTSFPADLKIDTRRPRAAVKRYRNRLVEVRLTDGRKGQVSGVDATTVKVTWGDGRRASGRTRLTHRYRSGGTFRVAISAKDKAGNPLKTAKRVLL